eukprot:2612213-Prymnesium_polylepis.1
MRPPAARTSSSDGSSHSTEAPRPLVGASNAVSCAIPSNIASTSSSSPPPTPPKPPPRSSSSPSSPKAP